MKTMIIASLAAAGVALTATPAMAEEKPKMKNWQQMDTDRSGTVSMEEWVAGNRNPNGHRTGDTNADGELTREEFNALRERWRQAQQRREAAGN